MTGNGQKAKKALFFHGQGLVDESLTRSLVVPSHKENIDMIQGQGPKGFFEKRLHEN